MQAGQWKGFSELCSTNPPNTEAQSGRVTISQVLHNKSGSTYGIEQIKLTLGLTPGKCQMSLHSILEEFSVSFLPYLDPAAIFLLFEWTPNLIWRLPG